MLRKEKTATTIPVQVNDRFLFIPLGQVTHFEARDKYVFLHTTDGKSYLTEHTLQGLCDKLPDNFLQVHRSYLINTDYPAEAAPLLGGRYNLRLNSRVSVNITTGPSYQADVKGLLKI